jgi:hypothetical protein
MLEIMKVVTLMMKCIEAPSYSVAVWYCDATGDSRVFTITPPNQGRGGFVIGQNGYGAIFEGGVFDFTIADQDTRSKTFVSFDGLLTDNTLVHAPRVNANGTISFFTSTNPLAGTVISYSIKATYGKIFQGNVP